MHTKLYTHRSNIFQKQTHGIAFGIYESGNLKQARRNIAGAVDLLRKKCAYYSLLTKVILTLFSGFVNILGLNLMFIHKLRLRKEIFVSLKQNTDINNE